MQGAFGYVMLAVVVVGILVGFGTLVSSKSAYEEIGKNGLNDGTDRRADEPLTGAGFTALRDEEARQMLEARNARRIRQGKEPLDVEAELARLVAAPAPSGSDPELVGEIRSLVQARNRRRIRQDKEPLDVEAEVARELGGMG